MTRVLIVDDEPLARARMSALLRECEDVQIVGSVGDGETALDQLDALLPDVLLLDINMPGVDGVSVAKRLAGRTRPQVIFCTAYEGYALKAFDLGAADYLLKPVRLERLRDALQRAQRRLADAPSGPTVWIHGRLRGGEVRIALDEVTCLIADEKYVCVHHRGGALLIEESLRQLEEAHPQQLIRLHRNCLVPPARLVGIKTLADGRVLARLDGSELAPEISRRNLPVIRKLLRLG
jgi:two-component system response regulator AlgR